MKKKDLKIIKDIQAEAWAKYGDKLFKEEDKAPAVIQTIDHALESPDVDDLKKQKLQSIKEAGLFSGKKKVEDPEVSKKFEEFVDKRIKEEIDAGRLSKPNPKKVKQYGNRKKRANK